MCVCVQYNIRFGRAAIYGIAFESISVFLGFNWFPAAQTSPRGRQKYTNYIYVLDSKRLACHHNQSNPYIYSIYSMENRLGPKRSRYARLMSSGKRPNALMIIKNRRTRPVLLMLQSACTQYILNLYAHIIYIYIYVWT